jgi:CRISPR/Cas system Type II protein with McrA/HNH and RuvC-like nuclease domain
MKRRDIGQTFSSAKSRRRDQSEIRRIVEHAEEEVRQFFRQLEADRKSVRIVTRKGRDQ